jgi:hypothetical protein
MGTVVTTDQRCHGAPEYLQREMVVGRTTGAYDVKPGHNIGSPYRSLLTRSLDDG